MNKNEAKKLLTIITVGRNDNYAGNFRYRLVTCINYLARSLKKINRLNDVEILITDWNSELPLVEDMPLLEEAAEICNFITVSPELAKEYNVPGQVFNTAASLNIALRKGQGAFMAIMAGDILISVHAIDALLRILDGTVQVEFDIKKSFCLLGRKTLPDHLTAQELSFEEWDYYLSLGAYRIPQDLFYAGLGGGASGQLMHRNLWYECRGYDERLTLWGWNDVELTLRMSQYYPWIDLSNFGVCLWEIGHKSNPEYIEVSSKWENQNTPIVHKDLVANGEEWGLVKLDLPLSKSSNIYSEEEFLEFRKSKKKIDINLIKKELKDLLFSRDITEFLQPMVNKWKISATDLLLMRLFAWFSSEYPLCKFLDVGPHHGNAIAIISHFRPGCEIYTICSLAQCGNLNELRESDENRFSLMRVFTVGKDYGHVGYARHMTGDQYTAFQRLKNSFVGKMIFEAILFRSNIFDDQDVVPKVTELLPHLADEGLFVFVADTEKFDDYWEKIQIKNTDFFAFVVEKGIGVLIRK